MSWERMYCIRCLLGCGLTFIVLMTALLFHHAPILAARIACLPGDAYCMRDYRGDMRECGCRK